jgi:hypothetical protein
VEDIQLTEEVMALLLLLGQLYNRLLNQLEVLVDGLLLLDEVLVHLVVIIVDDIILLRLL